MSRLFRGGVFPPGVLVYAPLHFLSFGLLVLRGNSFSLVTVSARLTFRPLLQGIRTFMAWREWSGVFTRRAQSSCFSLTFPTGLSLPSRLGVQFAVLQLLVLTTLPAGRMTVCWGHLPLSLDRSIPKLKLPGHLLLELATRQCALGSRGVRRCLSLLLNSFLVQWNGASASSEPSEV